ncbi:spermidine/putrescine transport system ATP-binding protein [Halarchaeum solikamskense]|uniref:ABC transporter ATP-binding protein n=1 Tax=Halarchaeum nitratireducens TaxID=489913 RepID=UPI001B3A9E85|nr:ABC transporter ATP-binding protein [Halarchaeum solikamskense]MBP2252401.1 spermidine/putrescine transport system ATP-binding protein [Halarchaeum solikamskense]
MSESGHVRLDALRKEYDDTVAVNGIDLEVQSGEFFTLLGPSGCGKSTTLRCIAGLETPTNGDVRISGQRVTSLPANKRDTSIVFQEWALFPHMTVGENVSFGLEMRDVPKAEREERVESVLELVELDGYQDRDADALSGGQKQRVAMARSIVQEPDVLLLDEPLASLDRALRERLQIELKEIQEELGITFVHVTHDQEEALTMSDRIAVMNDGQIEQVGEAMDLYEHPNTRFVASFLGETNLFEGRISRADGRVVLAGDIDVTLVQDDGVDLTEGQNAAYTVRPESLRLGADLAADNAWEGVVENAIYKGSRTLYEVDVGERVLTVQFQRQQGVERFDEGEDVLIGFDSDDGELVLS